MLRDCGIFLGIHLNFDISCESSSALFSLKNTKLNQMLSAAVMTSSTLRVIMKISWPG